MPRRKKPNDYGTGIPYHEIKYLSVLHVECEIQKAAREHRTAGFAGTKPVIIQ